jgi:4-hydroxy-2-oxoglutarate aldolase
VSDPLLRGILPPLVTPFRDDGALDLAAFEANLEAYAAAGFAGRLVLGSNGEAVALDQTEKLSLIRAARRHPGTLLAGTGLHSTRATIELTRRAADLGADAALVLTPYYYRAQMGVEALRRHYEAVADAAPIPILIYSMPAVTGLVVSEELVAALAPHPGIRGLKESSGDLGLLGRLLEAGGDAFEIACGSAPVLYPALCLGAAGGVLAVAGCAPEATVALYAAWERGDHEAARRLQRWLTPLALAVTRRHGVPGLKAAVEAAGYRGGSVRAPLLPAPREVREEVARLVAALRQELDAA